MIEIKSASEIAAMRAAGRLVAEAHRLVAGLVGPGVTTGELDQAAEECITRAGGIPSFKGYALSGLPPFPGSICASVNDEVVHGIPGLRKLVEGDIISIDIGAVVDGYHGDAAVTLPVGKIDPEIEQLLAVTAQALSKGIEQALAGHRLSDVSHAIQSWVEAHGFAVVRDFVGHGIGREMHEDPQIPNFGPPGRGVRLRPGMALAIEPMVNMGSHLVVANGWTVTTRDGLPSAHFEHTVVVGEEGPEVLTAL